MNGTPLPLAVSLGEPAGIGPDIILSAFQRRKELHLPPFCVFGCADTLRQRATALGEVIHICEISPSSSNELRDNHLPIVNIPAANPASTAHLDPANGAMVIAAIEQAAAAVQNDYCSALVTAPIHKKNLYKTGFSFPGHTEFLAELATSHTGKTYRPVMMIASDALRTVPVTIHIPLCDVPRALNEELIIETIRITHADLVGKFAIQSPKMAVAGLNPHAGEDGALGTEDDNMIRPALDKLRAEGMHITGPLSADTMFHPRARATYDAAICMYHDQALIPAKTLAFDDGVNVTLGLPFIRTSPDHGTALELAGTGTARIDSFVEALKMAAMLSEQNKASRA